MEIDNAIMHALGYLRDEAINDWVGIIIEEGLDAYEAIAYLKEGYERWDNIVWKRAYQTLGNHI